MGFHDGSADRKAESQTVLLCRRERIEQAAYRFALDARSIIQHADFDARRRRVSTRNDMNVAIRLPRGGDGIDGVMHEIEHDLLQLNPITMQIRQVGRRVEIDSNTPGRCLRICQSHRLLEHVPRVDRADMRMPATNEIPHAPHDGAGVVDVIHHG